MKWYFWVLIVVAIAVIGYFIWKNQMNKKANVLAEGSECDLTQSTRAVGPTVDNPISIVPVKGIIANGVCVSK